MIQLLPRKLLGRAAAPAAVTVALLLLSPHAAPAQQSPACQLLERELAAYDSTSRGGPEVQQLNQSILQQQNALSTTDSHARRIGCYKRGFLFFQPQRPPECGRLLNTVEQMRRNLADLTARRDRILGPTRGDDPGKQRILRLLAENRCGPQYTRYANVGRSRGLFGGLFEEDSGPREGWRGIYGRSWFSDRTTYRTLCVRSCDGYYFPISFATTQDRFQFDAQQCRARCPSAVVELYVHENPGGSVEQMVSLSGRPYAAIPTAFLYRNEYVKGCSCNPYSLALEMAEQLASATDPTVEVPDFIPQNETGAPASQPGAPESEAGPDANGVNNVEVFPDGGQGSGFLLPLPSYPGGTPDIIRIPPSGAEAPGFSNPEEQKKDELFQDPAALR